jgi:hypothetical protein
MIQIEATSELAKAYAAEDPPFAESVPVEPQFAENIHITRAAGGYVVNVDPYPREGKNETYVVTSKVKLIKLIKKIL